VRFRQLSLQGVIRHQTEDTMANQTKREGLAALQAAGISRKSYSRAQFCARHDLSEGHYRKIQKLGQGPQEIEAGGRRIITVDAEEAWLEACKV
jgi:hypothetical protein